MAREQSFQSDDKLYFDQQRNRVHNDEISEQAIYTALSKIKGSNSVFKSVAFPVRVESIVYVDEPQYGHTMSAIALRIVLLDQDFKPKDVQPFEAVIHEDMWRVSTPIPVAESGATPARLGYFLLSMPDDPIINF